MTPARVLLIEDEPPALARLEGYVEGHPATEVVGTAGSIESAYAWLSDHPAPDLVFADIELADGKSFLLFERWRPTCPVIFCTAFDEHVLEALGWNGIDYVLKPLREPRVHEAIDKYVALKRHFTGPGPNAYRGERLRYRRRLLVKRRSEFVALPVESIAYVTTEHKLSVVVLDSGERHLLDRSLSELEAELAPDMFFRASRQYLVHIDAVTGFEPAGKGRLEVMVTPRPGRPVQVSQPNAASFRAWLER
ncbi:MAG: LytR/AlgR family response regulator transcription factor [Sandaracinaceae bacterium]